MADFFKFRTSLNGFNRADVTEFIENLCADHQKELAAAREDSSAMANQLDDTLQALEQQIAQNATLQKELDDTKSALEFAQEALEEALTMPDEPAVVEEEIVEPEEEEIEEPEEAAPDYTALELEAYRRAEAMERASSLRAARLHQQLDALMEQISGRYGQTGQEIQALTEDIRTNLQRLTETLSDLDAIFDEATDSFDTMTETFPTEE